MTTILNKASALQSAWIKRIQFLSLVALVVYIANLSAQLTWFLVEGETKPVPSQVAINTGAESDSVSLRPIDAYHIFGQTNAKPVEQNKPVEAPKTRLRLLLKGVFTGDQSASSGAIIEEIGKSAEYYRIGDVLPGNATLEEVYPDRVLLKRGGKFETLAFDESAQTNSIARVESRPASGSGSISSPKDFIDEAARRLDENPERALNSVGLSLAGDGGYVFKGNNPMLSGMNLEKGDVIRSVNGHTLGDVNKDKELMRSLYEEGSVEVEVVRDGASFFVNYPLR
jgi:general secretion pathway protein C